MESAHERVAVKGAASLFILSCALGFGLGVPWLVPMTLGYIMYCELLHGMRKPVKPSDVAMDPNATLKAALGTCMTRARKHVAETLKKKALNIPFQDENIKALLQFHPRRKIKDYAYLCMRKMPPYNKPCLTVTMTDHRIETVSWTKCVEMLYGKANPERAKKQRVLQAFRDEIACSPKMCEARNKFSAAARCEGCDKLTKLHIDHDVKPFAMILDDFLESKKLQLLKVTLNFTAKPYMLMSRKLAREWEAYHDEQATLIGLCKECNSSKGSGGYRHKK
jgi:hypothetical protein